MHFSRARVLPRLLAFLLLTLLVTPQVAMGSDRVVSPYIVGGTAVAPSEFQAQWPWLMAIDYRSTYEESMCSGTLISPVFVLTAAHCVAGDHTASRYTVQTQGSFTWGGAGTAVTGAYSDPAYSSSVYGTGDVALLRLATPIFLASYPRLASAPADVGTTATALGFGLTSGTSQSVGTLRKVDLTVAAVDSAAGTMEVDDSKGTCEGDSGGPFVTVGNGVTTLIGTTSYGDADCLTTSVFTDVAGVLSWITSTIAAKAPLMATMRSSISNVTLAGTSAQTVRAADGSGALSMSVGDPTQGDIYRLSLFVPGDDAWSLVPDDHVGFELHPYDPHLSQVMPGRVLRVAALSCTQRASTANPVWTDVPPGVASLESRTSPTVMQSFVPIAALRAAITDGSGLCGVEVDVTAGDATLYPGPASLALVTASPARTRTPVVQVSGAVGTLIGVYATRDCTGPALTTATVLDGGHTDITLPTLARDHATPLSARASSSASAACSAAITYRNDSTPPVIGDSFNVVVETVRRRAEVWWRLPAAHDAVSSDLPVRCDRPDRMRLRRGSATATCTATDAVGNVAVRRYTLTVRRPTTGGRLHLDRVANGRLRVRASAAGFAPGSRVILQIGWVEVHGDVRADRSGRVTFDAMTRPHYPTGRRKITLTGVTPSGAQLTRVFEGVRLP